MLEKKEAEQCFYQAVYSSPLGTIFLMSDSHAIVGLWFEQQKYFQESIDNRVISTQQNEVLQACKDWLDQYFEGQNPAVSTLSLHPCGTTFQKIVWEILLAIPYGSTMTYAQIAGETARRMERKSMSAQAVGSAVAHNPISIIIPCHRVVGTSGSLTGYAGGISRKIALLTLEQADMSGLYRPKKGTAL